MKLSNNINSDHGFFYEALMNSQKYIIRPGITHQCQFSLGNIATMSRITDSIGEGWYIRRVLKYFNKEHSSANQQKEVPMTTLKHFEVAHIIFSTMKKMKLTMTKGNGKLFTIECYMPSDQPQNVSVCKQQSKMFKNDFFMFHPQKDLVLSMSFKFVDNFKIG